MTIIQARMSSSRLPGKVMLPILGKPLLYMMMQRLKASKLSGKLVVATTNDPEDDIIEGLCAAEGWRCYRGDKYDLLDRHYQASMVYEADIVLKIPSDCPLIDPVIVDNVIGYFLENSFDYVSNLHPATYPDGNDVEIMTQSTLWQAWSQAHKDFEREHTTPYIWENTSLFRIGNYNWPLQKDLSMSHRFTIDYPEDYTFIKTVFEKLYPENPMFGLTDILQLLDKEPAIYNINAKYAGVNWYRNHLDELHTINHTQTKII